MFVNRCNQEGVGILLLLMSKSIFVFRPSHLECVHHFPSFPLSPAAFFSCFHPVLTFTVLQPDSIPGRAGTKHTSCSQQSQMVWVCVLYRQWLALVPNTGHSQGFIFAWLSEQQRTPQLSSSSLRSTSCRVAALRVYDVMRVGHNLGIVYHAIATVEALLRTALYVHTCPPILNVF